MLIELGLEILTKILRNNKLFEPERITMLIELGLGILTKILRNDKLFEPESTHYTNVKLGVKS